MTQTPGDASISQLDFEKITTIVLAQLQVEESLVEHGVPTYYLKQPQETKQAFLRLLKSLEPMNLIALLRRINHRIVLKVISKPLVRKSNILINWVLFFATLGTTFYTGYIISGDMINPILGGGTFTIAMMAVLGMHEMGHKITASRNGVEATPPYFIPGPPPELGGFGTFGAVIMQKALPPNRDSLFDIGGNGPLIGFIVASIVSVIGFPFSAYTWIPVGEPTLPPPLLFSIIERFFPPMGPVPIDPHPGLDALGITLHPVAFAGWVGMLVTMLNLLPAAMLDGGHVSRSLLGDKARIVLAFLSILLLFLEGFWVMAILVLFIAMYKHPGPLDDVSRLSTGRKLMAVLMVAIFVLCSSLHLYVLQLFGFGG